MEISKNEEGIDPSGEIVVAVNEAELRRLPAGDRLRSIGGKLTKLGTLVSVLAAACTPPAEASVSGPATTATELAGRPANELPVEETGIPPMPDYTKAPDAVAETENRAERNPENWNEADVVYQEGDGSLHVKVGDGTAATINLAGVTPENNEIVFPDGSKVVVTYDLVGGKRGNVPQSFTVYDSNGKIVKGGAVIYWADQPTLEGKGLK